MLNEQRVGEFLAALGERTPTPASGAATALTGALAAALAELSARFVDDQEAVTRAKAAVTRLLQPEPHHQRPRQPQTASRDLSGLARWVAS